VAWSKFNTLHVHLTDAQSFPLVVPNFPVRPRRLRLASRPRVTAPAGQGLSKAGAYAPSAVYTSDDLNSIVQYGWERGVRVVPEIDGPGHAGGKQRGRPAS
jgi:hexosaminidase